MTYCPECDWQIEIARRMVAKDHRQRWVYQDRDGWHITDQPIPFRDALSVRWIPTVEAVVYAYRPRVLAHPAT